MARPADGAMWRRRANGVALLYHAGHGLHVNGRNYLMPVDADLKSEACKAETADVDSVLAQMQEARTRVNVVILDACREHPLARRFRSVTRGLAFVDAPGGPMRHTPGAGGVALDGEPGKNSVYTAESVEALPQPGLRIEDVFKRGAAASSGRPLRDRTHGTPRR